jgi:hypothetical protein
MKGRRDKTANCGPKGPVLRDRAAKFGPEIPVSRAECTGENNQK